MRLQFMIRVGTSVLGSSNERDAPKLLYLMKLRSEVVMKSTR